MGRNRSGRDVWHWYALQCIFWWGLWGFLAKLGSASTGPLQLQVLFTIGMIPVAIFVLISMRFRLETNTAGASYGILSGVFTGLGLLAYYAALQREKVSLVGPVSGLFPLLTVAMAFLVLR